MIVETACSYHHPGAVAAKITGAEIGGANVVFVNMPLRESAPPNCAPTGIALMAARLRQANVRVTCVDLNAIRVKDGTPAGRLLTQDEAEAELRLHFKRFGAPHVVAISGMVTTLRWQIFTAAVARKLAPGAFVVSGGGLATEFREGLFDWIPGLDAVAHSEGDDVILKIVYDAVKVAELGFGRAEANGHLRPYYRGRRNGRRAFVYDGGRPSQLDALPFPHYDVLGQDALETYILNPIWGAAAGNSSAAPFTMSRSINTISSRGCPFACRFCFRGATGERNYGVLTASRFAAEMKHLRDVHGVDFIGVFDDNFMVQRQRIFDLVPHMKPLVEAGLRWGTHGRLDEAADLRPGSGFNLPLRVDAMKEAGCVYIGFGAESANKGTLEDMGKGGFILANGVENIGGHEFPRTMLEGVRNTKRAGIHANLTWIMGYPGETLERLQTSVAFMEWQEEFYRTCGDASGTVNKQMFVATAYPGTEMFAHPRVRAVLGKTFGIKFQQSGFPVMDEALRSYVLELDDATKVLAGADGAPVYFGEMPEDQFLRARELVEAGRTKEILGMGRSK